MFHLETATTRQMQVTKGTWNLLNENLTLSAARRNYLSDNPGGQQVYIKGPPVAVAVAEPYDIHILGVVRNWFAHVCREDFNSYVIR